MAKTKSLYELVLDAIPELTNKPEEFFRGGSIILVEDETGQWIAKWNYSTPLPASLESYLRA